MDFSFSPQEEAYRAGVRDWLETNAGEWQRQLARAETAGDERFELQRAWHRELYAAGYVGATWPEEYGGRGRSAVENAILQEELVRARAPATVNGLGIGLCGPAILGHGRDDQKARYLPAMLRGEEIWCQGYSEPGAGSDLAAISTRAQRRGDRWVVTGQKIWTSLAHRADWCFALVRTDPEAARKHDGIGFLLIDMRSPGIEVRPITMITGESEFNEVFFESVEVPQENFVGAPTQGWRIANTVLGYERGANTLSLYAGYERDFDRLRQRVR
jgi:alkylation response protein AidB-like acyl-CoA dehydrogenase